jgi:clan AA aspartic protease
MALGLPYAQMTVENRFLGLRTNIRALVDTGAVFLIIPDAVAGELGFDITEVEVREVTLADGLRRSVPLVGSVRVHFAGRSCDVSALVFGDEPLLGVVPMEMMDLIVNPLSNALTVNPASPHIARAYAKGAR